MKKLTNKKRQFNNLFYKVNYFYYIISIIIYDKYRKYCRKRNKSIVVRMKIVIVIVIE